MGSAAATDYWRVEVKEPPDFERGTPGYTARFRFEGPGAALAAWSCWHAAQEQGFEATSEHVTAVVNAKEDA